VVPSPVMFFVTSELSWAPCCKSGAHFSRKLSIFQKHRVTESLILPHRVFDAHTMKVLGCKSINIITNKMQNRYVRSAEQNLLIVVTG